MKPVTKRELNQNTAAVLAQVTAADDIVITERGRPRWRVSAVRDEESTLDRLERSGHYTPPVEHPAPWPDAPGGPAYTDEGVAHLLDELRGDH